jgi:hypothetical protein
MLAAVIADCRRIPGVNVATTWDQRLGPPPFDGVDLHPVLGPEVERSLFCRLAANADATLVIAPELEGILAARAKLVEASGGRSIGSSVSAISRCADKLELAAILQAAGVETIETHPLHLLHAAEEELRYPAVVKPRDGAGSQETFLVRDAAECRRLAAAWRESRWLQQAIWQPFVAGRAVSVGVLLPHAALAGPCSVPGAEALPVCDQILSDDGRFAYRGGRVPSSLADPGRVQAAALRACQAVAGLQGYVGVDLIVPEQASAEPIVVEINPRLTTSYLGYAALTEENLAARMLFPERAFPPLRWKPREIGYGPSGKASDSQGAGIT